MIIILSLHKQQVKEEVNMKMLRKIGIITFLFLIPAIFLSGCFEKENTKDEDDIYNSVTGRNAENEDYIFYSIDDTEEDSLSFCNKKTGVTEKLVKNLFKDDWTIGNTIFKKGNCIYYMLFTKDYSERGLYEAYDKFRIIKVNTVDFSDKIIYEANANSSKTQFLGLQKSEDSNATFFQEITAFFLDDRNFYFITPNQIWQMSRNTGKKKSIIDISASKNVAYDGVNIYYINDSLQIVKYNTETKKTETLSDIATEYFLLTDSKLYYTDRRDENKIYSFDLINNTVNKISNQSVSSYVCDKQYIFYLDEKTYYLHRIDMDGSNDKVVLEKAIISIYMFTDYGKIYIAVVSDNNQIMIINKDTLEVES